MAVGTAQKLPIFHGDSDKYPEESWEGYELQLLLARMATGRPDVGEDVLKGLMLGNLKGKALRFLENNPDLLNKSYDEVRRIMSKKYTDSGVQDLLQLHSVIQKPNESVSEFMSRLRRAAKPLLDKKPLIEVLDQIKNKEGEIPDTTWDLVESINHQMNKKLDSFLYHHFMRGLNDKLRTVILAANPKDIFDAQNIAEAHEASQNLYNSHKKGVNTHTATQKFVAPSVAEPYEESDSEGEEDEYARFWLQQEDSKHRVYQVEAEKAADTHHKKQQDKNKQEAEEEGPARVCFYCGNSGHWIKDCYYSGPMYPSKLELALEQGMVLPRPGSRAHARMMDLRIKFEYSPQGPRFSQSKNGPAPMKKEPPRNFQKSSHPAKEKQKVFAHQKFSQEEAEEMEEEDLDIDQEWEEFLVWRENPQKTKKNSKNQQSKKKGHFNKTQYQK